MDLSLVSAVWCQVERPLRKADHSSTGVLLSMICLPKCDLETAGLDLRGLLSHGQQECYRYGCW